ncbi:VOC family protein [Sporichthya sp.]|uniref:VOC family protein n=1 Tax=Sporichthya sp. TaxID=65475 RepID=UPI0018272C0C|nr:VOC family protein [Sporichthya sp.]MBA3742737.1 VOC family protein [Sporichthya sp.]
MADPLEILRTTDAPVDPDPAFAARLRARLARALAAPEGVTVSAPTVDLTSAVSVTTPAAAPNTALTPYLAVSDARAAIDWYTDVFGGALVGEPYEMPDGRIGHAELRVAGARLYLADEFPEMNLQAPTGATSVTLHLAVPDVDALVEVARAAGAEIEREPADYPYGRNGAVRDPFGHRWLLDQVAPVPAGGDGDVGYFSLWMPDLDRAAAFYGAVLGWTFAERSPFARMIEGPTSRALVALDAPNAGFWPEPRPGAFTSRAVADIDGAVARVRAAGGRSTDPSETPYGRSADCLDDQGIPFSLHERESGSPRPALNGTDPGDVAYWTMQVPDAARARNFHAAVFGWTFVEGHAADGWQAEGPAPMTGLHGGHPQADLVPMYRVEDVVAAVERVRAAGGTATDPEQQPYGISSECVDDQGLPFYLGQL